VVDGALFRRPDTNDVPVRAMTGLSNTWVEIRRLGDIAEILPGYSTGTSLVHDPNGTHQVVLSKHLIPGLAYSYREEDAFRIRPSSASGRSSPETQWRNISRYELQRGDVLFMSRGTRNLASFIEKLPGRSIAPVSFFIIRFRKPDLLSGTDSTDPAYLTWYLNSPRAQNEIANIRTGAGTPIVQRSAFYELEVPIPAVTVQRHIGALSESMVRERLLHHRLTDAVARGHDATSAAIAHQLFTVANHSPGESE
jgi:hypothetical protein